MCSVQLWNVLHKSCIYTIFPSLSCFFFYFSRVNQLSQLPSTVKVRLQIPAILQQRPPHTFSPNTVINCYPVDLLKIENTMVQAYLWEGILDCKGRNNNLPPLWNSRAANLTFIYPMFYTLESLFIIIPYNRIE